MSHGMFVDTAVLFPVLLALIAGCLVPVFLLARSRSAAAAAAAAAGLKPIPTLPATPLLGHIPLLASHFSRGLHPDLLFQELGHKLGRVFELNLGAMTMVCCTEPEFTKEVVHWPKSATYRDFFPIVGEKSILVQEGEGWKRQRSAFNPGFSMQHLRTLIPTFTSDAKRLAERMETLSKAGEVVPLHKLLTIVTLNIICEVVTGRDFDMLNDEKTPELYNSLVALIDYVQWFLTKPLISWSMTALPWNKQRLREHQKRYDDILLRVIRDQTHALEAGESADAETAGGAAVGGAAVGGAAVQRSVKESILTTAIRTAKKAGDALDEESVLSQVKTFMFGGHDTTASTVAWAVYELTRNREVERKMVEELDEVCEGRDPTTAELSDLLIMECVVRETLRVWPPAGTARQGPPGARLGDYDVSGKVVFVPHYVMHHDKGLFGEEADVWKPERWMDEAWVSKLHPFAYQPFSKGPRDCIGQSFAKLEAKAILATLYQRFTFEYAGAEPESKGYNFTSHPRLGCPMHVKLRQQ